MTIPTLLTNLQNKKLESQFKEGYSIMARAVRMATNDNESFFDRSQGFNYRNFIKYFNGATDCGGTAEVSDDSDFCMVRLQNIDGNAGTVTNKDKNYRNFSKTSKYIATNNLDDDQFYLMNGILIMFDQNRPDLLISIDINGKKQGPNIWGYDLFTFQLKQSEFSDTFDLVPMGAPDTYFTDKNAYCSKTSGSTYNGIACAYYAMQDSNYFKSLSK